jgi:predicted DNA repair protein MutK
MPKLLKVLSVVGTAAMLWVGGHIILAGADELGWHAPYDVVHDLEHTVHDTGGASGVLEWLINTAASAALGFVVGALLVGVISLLPKRKAKEQTEAATDPAPEAPPAH